MIHQVKRRPGRVTIEADEGTFTVSASTPDDLRAAADENAERRRRQWNDGLTRERLYQEAADMWADTGVTART